VKKKRVKGHEKRRQGWEEGRRKRRRSEDRRLVRSRWMKLGREKGRKGKRICPRCRMCRTRYESHDERSFLKWTLAPGGRVRVPEGRRRRKTGGEVRREKNTIIKAARHDERRRV